MEKDNKFELTLEDGKVVQAEIIFTHYSEKFKKNYVVFLPEGDEQFSAACYLEEDKANGELLPIETDEEWALLEDLLNDYFSDLDDEEQEEDN